MTQMPVEKSERSRRDSRNRLCPDRSDSPIVRWAVMGNVSKSDMHRTRRAFSIPDKPVFFALAACPFIKGSVAGWVGPLGNSMSSLIGTPFAWSRTRVVLDGLEVGSDRLCG